MWEKSQNIECHARDEMEVTCIESKKTAAKSLALEGAA